MTTPAELSQAIQRVRRAQPRNPDTMLLCDALEARPAVSQAPIIAKPLPDLEQCPDCAARRKATAARVAKHRLNKDKP